MLACADCGAVARKFETSRRHEVLSPGDRERSTLQPSETLLVIDVISASGVVILQTVWATTADLKAGHRRTDSETCADAAAVMHKLGELMPAMFRSGTLAAAA
jgi:hypothetical protein